MSCEYVATVITCVARILRKSRRDVEMKVRLLIGDYLGTYGLLNLRSTGSVIRYESRNKRKSESTG
jgi:hypothetical protein